MVLNSALRTLNLLSTPVGKSPPATDFIPAESAH